MTRIVAINGSYRSGGITDQTVDVMVQAAEQAGARVEVIYLREYPIEFCLNCRACTQQPGEVPGTCVLDDGMQELVNKIEQADGYILACPVNFGTATAVFKRFMERLVVYAYWPWQMNSPEYRKANAARKKAILVSSCAAPGFIGRWFSGTRKQLNMTAKVIGADGVGILFTGLIAKEFKPKLPEGLRQKAGILAAKLI